MNLNDGTHSRHDPEHYKNCQPCFEDHLDFEDETRQDEAADAALEQSELEEGL